MNSQEMYQKVLAIVKDKGGRELYPQTTYEQIVSGNETIVMSWGAFSFKGVSNKGLIFAVKGAIHKGFVLVTLNFMDTYDIHLINSKGEQVGDSVTDIYFDQLTEIIDGLVETPKALD